MITVAGVCNKVYNANRAYSSNLNSCGVLRYFGRVEDDTGGAIAKLDRKVFGVFFVLIPPYVSHEVNAG